MGIKFYCPNGHKLNVKSFLAGKRGICPQCGAKVDIPAEVAAATASPQPASTPRTQFGTKVPAAGPVAAVPTTPNPAPAATTPVRPAPGPGASGPGAPPTVSPGAPAAGAFPVSIAPGVVPARTVPADPIAEAPNAAWYVRPPSGGQFGPASGEVMRRWISEGRVTAESMVWREGWPDWTVAGPLLSALSGGALLSSAATPAAASPQFVEALGATGVPVSSGPSVRHSPSAGGYYPRRRKSNSTVIAVVVVLVMAIITLTAVLIHVATRA